jgi:hypothetical protein
VTATISSFVTSLDMPIEPAYPDVLLGETDHIVVKLDGSTKATISILASRARGTVSTGIPIAFTAQQRGSDGAIHSVGRFTGFDGVRTNSAGKATIAFSADTGDVIVKEPITIRASTMNDQGAPVAFELQVRAE